MMLRNPDARLIKLEARRHRPNEILLIWRRPDADVKAAISGAKFAPGDRVICVEWFGDGSLPSPRWYRERLSSELGVSENEYLDRCLTESITRVKEGRERDPGFADIPHVPAERMRELTDNDLLHMVFGVAT
jgi:hypothetical protein